MNTKIPVVYACSGCSNVAQMANDLALKLTDEGIAEMSCIAGVGGKVPALVNRAKIAETIVAIDGCQLHCCQSCLDQIGVGADLHVKLYEFGQKKVKFKDYDKLEAARIYKSLLQEVAGLSQKKESRESASR